MTYEDWLATLQDTVAAHELTYDAEAVRRLGPGVRERAEAELVRRVGAGDTMAFEPAGALGLSDAAADLERHRSHGTSARQSAAARALFLLRGDTLEPSKGGLERGLDAYALKTSDRPEAIPALLALLHDPSVHARVHASEGLVEKLGLNDLASPRGSPLRRMMLAICTNLRTLWPLGARELYDVLSAVHGGAAPEALGLPYAPSRDADAMARFWAEATGWRPFDLANLAAMGVHDRAFAETVLIARLVSGDLHALAALRGLEVQGWPAHVRAALPLVAAHAEIAKAYADATAPF
jgi:hypothetical protein